jgi:hypothetical protein
LQNVLKGRNLRGHFQNAPARFLHLPELSFYLGYYICSISHLIGDDSKTAGNGLYVGVESLGDVLLQLGDLILQIVARLLNLPQKVDRHGEKGPENQEAYERKEIHNKLDNE